jgi:cysteine desulfurase / selenocysteine lyase
MLELATKGHVAEDWRGDFAAFDAEPGLVYLDTGATALKPRGVVAAIERAYAIDYATVHRGVYRRSAEMTERYEAARQTVADFIGAASAREIVFTRGATEAINVVAASWGGANLKPGDEILLTQLEHHSNIVPWQLIAEKTGARVVAAPITADGDLDYPALAGLITARTRIVAVTHVSNVLGTRIDIPRIANLAHAAGALLLVDGCQAAPHMAIDVQALGADFYTFSGHKLYGPTGIGVLWARAALLEAMPPYQGGGAMIETVTFERSTYAPPPQRFEAGTPHIVGALGLASAIAYVQSIGLDVIEGHEAALVAQSRDALRSLNSVRLLGPDDSAGIVSFVMEGVHPHDIGTILDESGLCIRAGHHCAQPLMAVLGVPATARASFGVYNRPSDVVRLVKGLETVARIFR